MKHTIPSLCLAALLAFATSAVAEIKIGTVNMKAIFSNYYKTKDADVKMREARSTVTHDVDELNAKIKALEEDINKDTDELKKPEISDAKKAPIAKGLEKKVNDWKVASKSRQEFVDEKTKQMEGLMLRMRNGIVEDITKVVMDRVKADNFDLVFDTSGFSVNNVPVVMFAKSDWDFTKDIIEKLNADKPASSSSDKPADPAPVTPSTSGPKTDKGPTPKKNK